MRPPVLLPAADGFVSKLDDLAHVATAVIVVALVSGRRWRDVANPADARSPHPLD
jgi:hypothetical protein